MSKHTPGEWIISGISQEDGSISIAKGQIVLCYVTNAASFFEVVRGQHPSVQFANARLIAAAPELLEALESIADCCNEDDAARDYASRQAEIRGIARAAIAKATGEQK